MPVELQLLDDARVAGGQQELRLQVDAAGQDRLALFTASLQQILDAPLVDRDVERDVASLDVLRADDGALRPEQRLADLRVDALELGVAVGAVDDRRELRHQVDRRAGEVDAEVGDVGRAVDLDALERAAVAALPTTRMPAIPLIVLRSAFLNM